MTTWYREGLVTLTAGSDLVAGVGTEWVDNVLPGGIFFTPAGLVEVERVISDTSLKLVTPYAGPSVAGAEYAIAPTQGYVVDLAKQVNAVLGTFGELKDAWQDGALVGKGVALKGVKDTVGDLPATGNAAGDAWMVDGHLHVWTGTATGWLDQGSTVSTPELEALRDAAGTSAGLAIGSALAADTTRKDYEDHVYPGVYATPPTNKPHSGAPCADGDRCVVLVGATPYEHIRVGGGWLIPNIDAVNLAMRSGSRNVGFSHEGTGAGGRSVEDKLRERVSLSDFEVVSGTADQSAKVQAAANKARALGVPLVLNAITTATVYAFTSVNISGIDVISEPGVSLVAPSGATGYAFTAMGTAGARITRPTRLFGARHSGGGTQLGLFQAQYANDVFVDDCVGQGYPMTSMQDGAALHLNECLRPVVNGGRYDSGRTGVLFISCTSPKAIGVTTNGQGRDGILFYTNPTGTTTTDALSDGCVATNWAMNREAGRAGVHFYGVRRALAVAATARGDSGQTHDDTGGVRFRDCEDYSASGYKVSDCMSGVLANAVGDYAGAPHLIVNRGTIGAGSVDGTRKFGVAVVGTGIFCPVNGANVSNVATAAGGAGIYHSGTGAIMGCNVADMACSGITGDGNNAISGNTLVRAGNGSAGLPAIRLGGRGQVGGNHISDDRSTPIATLGIRATGVATLTLGENHFGAGVTDPVHADAGTTVRRDSAPVRMRFSGLPTALAGTVEDGVRAIDASGIVYARQSGTWRRAVAHSLGSQTVGTTATQVQHQLGYAPSHVTVLPLGDARVWQSSAPDATYIYLIASASVACRLSVQ